MVKRKFDKNQTKLGIKTLDWNVPKDHISRFVVDFIEDVFPLLEIDETKKKIILFKEILDDKIKKSVKEEILQEVWELR